MSPNPAGGDPDISFIVPTYGEADNLVPLLDHIKEGLAGSGLSWELIIANDESGDATAAVYAELAAREPIRLLNRTENRGLALAVIDGAGLARGEHLVVMDADQSHPASLVPEFIKRLRSGDADFVIGSRKVKDASTDSGWPVLRHIGTFCATALARPLVRVKDPMAGFFALRRSEWPDAELRPIGYKIGLELIVRGGFPPERVLELPIHFTDRRIGKSKMGLRELNNYIRHVLALYYFRWPWSRFLMHCYVGTQGLAVDIALYFLLQHLGASHLLARFLSYWPSTVHNWWFNRIYTYGERPPRPKRAQLREFTIVSLVGLGVNFCVYYALTEYIAWFDGNRIAALLVGVLAGLLVNFWGSNLRVYGRRARD